MFAGVVVCALVVASAAALFPPDSTQHYSTIADISSVTIPMAPTPNFTAPVYAGVHSACLVTRPVVVRVAAVSLTHGPIPTPTCGSLFVVVVVWVLC